MSTRTKNELIYLLESERKQHKKTKTTLSVVVSESQNDADEIERLKNELRISELTIVRMATDETIRQNFEVK